MMRSLPSKSGLYALAIVVGVVTRATSVALAAGTSTYVPVADTEVRAETPTVNYGTAKAIGLDGSPVRLAYLRFNVTIPPGEVVTSATLKLFMTSSSSASIFARQVSSTAWGETTTTYNNAPALGAQVAASGSFAANAYLSMNVASLISGSGAVSVAVTRSDSVAVVFSSREAPDDQPKRPQLVVTTVPVVDTTAPTVAVSAPAADAIIAGSAVGISANASDDVGVVGVQFKIDGNNIGSEITSAPFSSNWDTTTVPNGPHTLSAVARDYAGNSVESAPISVTVSNVSVAITAPAAGAILTGPATVSATVSDNVVGVQFQIDGNNIGEEDTSAPYQVTLDTTAAVNGQHTLTAVARNVVGYSVSSQIQVKTANTSTTVITTVADTEVNSDTPTTNYGKATAMGLDGSPIRVGYLLFNVSVPDGETITKATLRVFATASSSADTFVRAVSDTEWGETTTTYSTAPPLGAQIAASGPYAANTYVAWDITSAVTTEGLRSFALARTSSVASTFKTRESGSDQPQLIIESFPTSNPPPPPPPPPPPVPPTVSADALPTWQIDGVVWSQVLVNNILYATGSFTKARPPGVAAGGAGEIDAQNIFAYDITTGERVASFNHSLNAQGLAITASPDGSRVYVGGDFTTVDGVARGHVASFRTASGALDLNFRPTVQGPVTALAITNTKVYVGGSFASVNGLARSSLAALDAINGSDLGWAPAIDSGTASRIWSMVLAPDRSRVIVGGSFTALNGTPAYGMGALNATTGATMPWAANQVIRDAGEFGAIYSLRADATQIYGTGYSFQDKTTTNFEGTFAADPKTGNLTLVNDCLGDTYDVLPLGPVLYSVGHAHNCSYIGSFPDTSPTTVGRVRWQRALAQTIAPTTVNTGPDAYGWNYSGRPASTVLHWFPQLSAGSYTGATQAAYSIVGNDNYIALGGEFPSVNGTAQQGLVRMAVRAIAPNKRGPTYNTLPTRPIPPTTATSTTNGAVDISFGTAWDNDNETLKYDLFRNGSTLIYSTTIATNFWTLPTVNYTDTSLAPGASAYYQVRITDPNGNTLWSLKSGTVTGCCMASANVAEAKGSQVLRVGSSSARAPEVQTKRIYVDPLAPKYRPVRRQGKSAKGAIPASSAVLRTKAFVRYSDRVTVRLDKAINGTEKGLGRGGFPGRSYIALSFVITNNSNRPIDLNQVVVTTEYGSPARIAAPTYDSASAAEFAGVLRPGKSTRATYAFAIPLPPRKVVVTVDVDATHAPARFLQP